MPNSTSSGEAADHTFEPVSPIDIVQPNRRASVKPSSLKSPRTARFAEATAVISPIEPSTRSPFADPPSMAGSDSGSTAPKVSDVGFGYVSENQPVRQTTFSEKDAALRSNPPASPLKSALKVPGTPGRLTNPLSPTFREEQILEHHEKQTDKENVKDLKAKTRVRLAKVFLRGINFSCSLIILVLIAQSFVIFNATKNLAMRNGMSPWAPGTNPWPQIMVLVMACVSLFLCIGVFYGYCRGGHKRAEKVGVYYTIFAVFVFATSIIIWIIAAAVFQNSKSSSDGRDFWGWSCKDNSRSTVYHEVNYEMVCRMQDWILICIIIEIVVDTITIAIYAVVFYRFWSKRKLRKSMDARDKARSDLYLAQLRSQSAPNTPGFPRTPMSPASPYMKPDQINAAENGQGVSTQYASSRSPGLSTTNGSFRLQRPPTRVHENDSQTDLPVSPGLVERVNDHMGAAPGEKTYDSVPIPAPLASPAFAPQQDVAPGTAMTSEKAVETRTS